MTAVTSTFKPFVGEDAQIQRSALRSWGWTGLSPIVVGGRCAGADQEPGIDIYEPDIPASCTGIPLVRSLIALAQDHSVSNAACIINGDIVLPPAFEIVCDIAERTSPPFLFVGRRRTIPATELIRAVQTGPDSTQRLSDAYQRLKTDSAFAIDYFLFSRGLFDGMPDFVVGRPKFDNWLVWKALETRGAMVVDCTPTVLALHPEHAYEWAGGPQAAKVTSKDAKHNRELLGSQGRIRGSCDATHILVDRTLYRATGTHYRWGRARTRLRRLKHFVKGT